MKKILLTTLSAAALNAFIIPMSGAETLDEAMSFAIQNHPSTKAAIAGKSAAMEGINEQKSGYYPSISANLSAGRSFVDNTTTRGLSVQRGTGYSYFGEGSATLNQMLYDWSDTTHKVNAARARHISADANLDDRYSTIMLQTAQAYIQVVRAQTLLRKARRNLTNMRDYRKRIKSLVDEGGADDSELSRADDTVSLAQNMVFQLEADLDMARASYTESVGREPNGKLTEKSIVFPKMPDDFDSAIDTALENHPQIRAANYEAHATRFDAKSAGTTYLPKLGAEMSYSQKDQKDLIGGESEDARALVRLTWNYDAGGGQRAAERRAARLSQEASLNREALERTIERDVKIAWTSVQLAKRQKRVEAKRLKAARATLKTYKEQYEAAQKTVPELMATEMQLFNTEMGYRNMHYRLMDAQFALATTMGIITPKSDLSMTEMAVLDYDQDTPNTKIETGKTIVTDVSKEHVSSPFLRSHPLPKEKNKVMAGGMTKNAGFLGLALTPQETRTLTSFPSSKWERLETEAMTADLQKALKNEEF